jgi:hypothetical protein
MDPKVTTANAVKCQTAWGLSRVRDPKLKLEWASPLGSVSSFWKRLVLIAEERVTLGGAMTLLFSYFVILGF